MNKPEENVFSTSRYLKERETEKASAEILTLKISRSELDLIAAALCFVWYGGPQFEPEKFQGHGEFVDMINTAWCDLEDLRKAESDLLR